MADSAGRKTERQCRLCPWVWGGLILLALAGVVWYVQNPPAPQGRPGHGFGPRPMPGMAVPVRVAEAGPATITQTVTAIGTVTAFNTVAVRSRVDGELRRIAFTDGQRVQAGDLLAEIDPRPYQVQLDQALGQQAQNAAQLKNAQRDLQRYRTLYQQNSVARQVLDAQEAQVQQLQGSRQSDQASVDNARLQLAFTRIEAPIGGRLGLRRLDQGNLISAANADGLVTITQTQPIATVFTVPQTVLPDVLAQVRAGQTLSVDLYDREDRLRIASGVLASLDNQIDVATGTLKLRAEFANEDETLFPNQFVNVRLRVGSREAAVTVPMAAVQYGSIGAFVYVVGPDDTVAVRRVILGRDDGVRIEVESGLGAGDRVVIEGTDRLREGARVEVHLQDGPASAPATPATRGGRARPPQDGAASPDPRRSQGG